MPLKLDRIEETARAVESSHTFNQGKWGHAEMRRPRWWSCKHEMCATPGCIAGHVCVLAGRPELLCSSSHNGHAVMEFAGFWLGLTQAEAESLFRDNRYFHASRNEAAATLRRIARTGEVDWKYLDLPVPPSPHG